MITGGYLPSNFETKPSSASRQKMARFQNEQNSFSIVNLQKSSSNISHLIIEDRRLSKVDL